MRSYHRLRARAGRKGSTSPILWLGTKKGAPRRQRRHYKTAQSGGWATDKARMHSTEHRRQSGGRTRENGQRRRRVAPPKQDRKHTTADARRSNCTAQGGGSRQAETQDRKNAPSKKGGALGDGDHVGQRQNIGSRTFRSRRLLPSERPFYYLI